MSRTTTPQRSTGTSSKRALIADLAGMVRAAVGYRGNIVFDRTKPDGTPHKLMDVSRLSVLGWRPTVSLEHGLRFADNDYLAGLHRA